MIGVFGQINNKTRMMFLDLWIVDTLRGDDSSGVAFVNKQNHIKILKDTGTPHEVIYTKAFSKANEKEHIAILGHNRFATIGDVTQEMAHPHQINDIIGTHNGTIRNRHFLPDEKKYQSDSLQLFASISNKGIKETWKNIDGATAIVWWDRKTKTLNMLKNLERTLFFTYIGGDDIKEAVAYASEAWMLESIAKRKNISIGTIWRPVINTHYQFFLDKKQVLYRSTELESFSWIKHQSKPYKWPNKGKRWDSNSLEWVEPKEVAYHDMKNKNNGNIINNPILNKNISEEEFLKKYKICDFCDGDLDESAYVSSVIIDTKTIVCAKCVIKMNINGTYENNRKEI